MGVDQAGAVAMWVPQSITFNSVDPTWVVIHKTAGFTTAQECAAYFQSGSNGRNVSAHYVVGLDGTIIQCVPESRGAGANCCLEQGHEPFLPQGVNLNLKTISIEHIDPTTDNSTVMPEAQAQASFKLIHDICERHNIPMEGGNAVGGIIGHYQIAPISRARCPGNYPWGGLWTYLKGDIPMGVPADWKDDGTTLTAPNGVPVVLGFRQFILDNGWDSQNFPLAPEYHTDTLEDANPALGGGSQQVFRWSMLEYTPDRGVFVAWVGAELVKVRQERDTAVAALTQARAGGNQNVKKIVDQAISDLQSLA